MPSFFILDLPNNRYAVLTVYSLQNSSCAGRPATNWSRHLFFLFFFLNISLFHSDRPSSNWHRFRFHFKYIATSDCRLRYYILVIVSYKTTNGCFFKPEISRLSLHLKSEYFIMIMISKQ